MGFDLDTALLERRKHNLYRSRRVIAGPQQPQVVVDGCPMLSFCSNDYLGLANHPDVIAAFQHAANDYGVGSGASHLVTGHSHAHHQLEEALADFTGRPRALLFSNGYMANLGVISALLGKGDAVFQDRLNHASLLDAGLLSGARFQRFLHCNPESLEQKLATSNGHRKLVVADGVFSMDGNIAPIKEYANVAQKHDAWLMVDDAHGFGTIGNGGRGSLEHFGLSLKDVPILIGTLGKAFGTAGAFVVGSKNLIETLIQFSRTYIYTTSIPPALAIATLASLKILKNEQWRRDHLQSLIHQFRHGCEQLGLPLMDSTTPIQPIIVGTAEQAVVLSEKLAEHHILVTAIRPPTVPSGSSRLRITLSAAHTESDVNRLLAALERLTTKERLLNDQPREKNVLETAI